MPGRNNAVKVAMIFILELSLARASVSFFVLAAGSACDLVSSRDAWLAFKLESDAS